jgi:hypothetical protein
MLLSLACDADHIMKTADSASAVTGPVVDFKLQAHQAKLKVQWLMVSQISVHQAVR